MTENKHSTDFTEKDIARFMSYVCMDNNTGSWIWTGGISSSGYGAFWFNGKTIGAHRVSYAIRYGRIPEGMQVCHKYEKLGRHNVNPDHLFLGTQDDNNKDMARKNRTAYGERNGASTLTEDQVIFIRESSDKYLTLSKKYSVSETIISKIKRGSVWLRAKGSPKEKVKIHSLRNKSGYRGVCWKHGAWEASICVTLPNRKRTIYLGRYTTPSLAATAYDVAAIKYRGTEAKLNFSRQSN